MIRILNFNSFINESLINVSAELDAEIKELVDKMLQNPECEVVDEGVLEVKTPFEINPDAKNRDWVNKTTMVFYPELLAYGDPDSPGKAMRTPWIACQISLEGEKPEEFKRDLLKWFVELLKKSGYVPFMDEDAVYNHWKDDKGNGWTDYICYVNPSYPEGHWENHALE